jgi:hypothetical protein
MSAPIDAMSLLAEQNPDVTAQPVGAAAAAAAPAAASNGVDAPLPALTPSSSFSARAAPEKSGWMVMNSYSNPEQFKRYWYVLPSMLLRVILSLTAAHFGDRCLTTRCVLFLSLPAVCSSVLAGSCSPTTC